MGKYYKLCSKEIIYLFILVSFSLVLSWFRVIPSLVLFEPCFILLILGFVISLASIYNL